MADKKSDKETKPEQDQQPAEAAESAGPRRPSGLMTIVKAAGFVSVIVVVEVVAASMFIPSAQDTERLARQYIAASTGDGVVGGHEAEGHGEAAGADIAEVELGMFNITHFNPATNSTLSIDFELFGAVLAADQAEFHELFEKNKIRVREQVILTLHAAEAKDLSDSGLGLIKRQILEKTNRALGHPLLREVLFGKFNYLER